MSRSDSKETIREYVYLDLLVWKAFSFCFRSICFAQYLRRIGHKKSGENSLISGFNWEKSVRKYAYIRCFIIPFPQELCNRNRI